mgnify:CR=1 FL=1
MARKKTPEIPHDDHPDETWLVPYSDLLCLLLALFIVLFSSSNLDKNKAAQIQYALAAAFGSDNGEGSMGDMMTNFINDAKDLNLEENGVIISSDANGATLEMTSINLFDKGAVTLKPEAIPVIKKISLLLNGNKYKKYRIVVEGHTDDTNESDTLPSNWELSGARAGAVVRAMIANSMDINRFKAVGLAEISPAYPNMNPYGEPIPENRIKNRRVIVRIEF